MRAKRVDVGIDPCEKRGHDDRGQFQPSRLEAGSTGAGAKRVDVGIDPYRGHVGVGDVCCI